MVIVIDISGGRIKEINTDNEETYIDKIKKYEIPEIDLGLQSIYESSLFEAEQ